jgi:hypothetical protein
MKITQDLRAEVQAMGAGERAALEGIAQKSKEFFGGRREALRGRGGVMGLI